jgi:hypothetical protein
MIPLAPVYGVTLGLHEPIRDMIDGPFSYSEIADAAECSILYCVPHCGFWWSWPGGVRHFQLGKVCMPHGMDWSGWWHDRVEASKPLGVAG